eukprot:UN02393
MFIVNNRLCDIFALFLSQEISATPDTMVHFFLITLLYSRDGCNWGYIDLFKITSLALPVLNPCNHVYYCTDLSGNCTIV